VASHNSMHSAAIHHFVHSFFVLPFSRYKVCFYMETGTQTQAAEDSKLGRGSG